MNKNRSFVLTIKAIIVFVNIFVMILYDIKDYFTVNDERFPISTTIVSKDQFFSNSRQKKMQKSANNFCCYCGYLENEKKSIFIKL